MQIFAEALRGKTTSLEVELSNAMKTSRQKFIARHGKRVFRR